MAIKFIFPIIIGLSGIALSACSFPFGGPQYAGLQVNSEPKSSLYIDDKHVGETNYYDTKIKADEHIIKLTPMDTNGVTWETRVKLIAGLTTVINRTFGKTPQESSYYVVQLEKLSNKKETELTIITTPENVIVRLDDQPKGFSPLTNIGVSSDAHKITLSAPGYRTENITVNPVPGYRLILNAELGKSLSLQPSATAQTATPAAEIAPTTQSATTSATPTPSIAPTSAPQASPTVRPTTSTKVLEKPYVEISETPTGWLRVRAEPNGLVENEVAKVDSGTSHPFIETNDNGWYKIEYEVGKQGWVAATYSKLIK